MTPSPGPSRAAFVLLLAMTLSAFGGPVGFGVVLRGGPSPVWPPDRTIEWWTLGGITALVLGLMVAAVAVAAANQRAAARIRASRHPGEAPSEVQH